MAAVVSVRLDCLIRKELSLPVGSSYYWCDSTATLYSIKNRTKRFPVFTANRLAVIERHSDSVEDWRYVPSALNPADEVSRGLSIKRFVNSNYWISEPDFLHDSNTDICSEIVPKAKVKQRSTVAVIKNLVSNDLQPVDRLVRSFSSLHKLKGTTAWLLRFCAYLTAKHCKETLWSAGPLTYNELNNAEKVRIAYEQHKFLPALHLSLKTKGTVKRSDCGLAPLKGSPKLDNDLIVMEERLRNAPTSLSFKCPVLLPAELHLTTLFVLQCHAKCGHGGVCHTFTELRARFWIEKSSSTIRKVINDCLVCRKVKAKCLSQKMSDLPPARMQIFDPPFSHTGVDFFGPLLVK